MNFKNLFKLYFDESRVFGLDILRFFAIMFVVVGHSLMYLPRMVKGIVSYFIFDGVTIFFVLSGFLIGGILIKVLNKESFTFKTLLEFWKRRWFRTLPAYLLVLILLLGLNIIYNENFIFNSDIIKYFLFLQNFKTPHPSFFPEAWSLSIEEWFYLISPIMIFSLINLLNLSVKKAVLITILSIIVFTTSFRVYRLLFNVSVTDISIWDLYYRKQVITRLDSLMYGVLAAYIKAYYNRFFESSKKYFFCAGIILLIIHQYYLNYGINPFFDQVLSFSFISISTMFLLPFLDSIKSAPKIILRPITYVSLTSYSMYLIHYSLVQKWIIGKIDFFKSSIVLNIGVTFSTFFILTMGLSILMYKYFEIPTTKLRDGLLRRKPQDIESIST